jgi:hypothetical protein
MLREVETVSSLISIPDKLKKELDLEAETWNPWYRGHADAQWRLLPSIYRSEVDPYFERELLRDFKILLSTEANFSPNNEMDWLFIAQYHGLLTRILDCSENFIVVIFFYVENHENDKDVKIFSLHLINYNEATAFSDDNTLGEEKLQSVPTSDQKKYFSKYILDLDTIQRKPEAKRPMAFRPKSLFKRPMSQSGVFTIHGNEKKSIEELPGVEIREIIVPSGNESRIFASCLIWPSAMVLYLVTRIRSRNLSGIDTPSI